ncbi:MAG: hypothetical protein IJB00_03645 [Akkermansia sp.]|nr:hypothetical protein [Akkermansia sp.]
MSNTPSNTALTALDICNTALCKLGEAPLSAIDSNGTLPSRLCYMHYHPARREVLCATRWTFATKKVKLSSAETSVDGEHSVAHSLPLDCLRVLHVNSPQWVLRGRCIYCPAAEIKLCYTADTDDCSLFEPLFAEALATRLACKLCIPLINSTTALQALRDEYRRVALPQAAHANAVQAASNDSLLMPLARKRSRLRGL